MSHPIIIGTRGSPLALAQSGLVRDRLATLWPEHRFVLKTIKTTGDLLQESIHKPLESTKAIFTKEIEEALLQEQIDLAIHSAKDLAAEMPHGLSLGAVPERASPCDILLLKPGLTLKDASVGVILTGSARRRRQWLDLYPQSRVEPIRGNIDTRLRRMVENPEATGLLLAEAGLGRLKPNAASSLPAHPMDPICFIPAPGQGTLALQCRQNHAEMLNILEPLHHEPSALALRAERSFLKSLNAGCSVPLGALATLKGTELEMSAVFYAGETSPALRFSLSGHMGDPEALGRRLAVPFLEKTRTSP